MKRFNLVFIFVLAFVGWAYAESSSIDVPSGSEQRISASSQPEKLELDRVVIGEQSTLILPRFKSITIQKLIAKAGAKIQLMHSGGESPARFFLNEIDGHILIEARGLDGTRGRDGRNGRQGRNGADGRRARTLLFGLFYIGNGEDGKPGEPGENGENGADGGDGTPGGRVTVYYQEKADFADIVIDVDGGKGGEPGAPGLGGLGGNGGHGGFGLKLGLQGPMGVNGTPGFPGRPGRPGASGRAGVYQLSKELFDCLSKLDARSQFEDLGDEDYRDCRSYEAISPLPESPKAQLVAFVSGKSNLEESEDGSIYLNSDGADGKDAKSSRVYGATPLDGSAGANGGNLTVLVREIPKAVYISARGGKGGSGAQGSDGQKGIDGYDGQNANAFRKSTPGTDGLDGGRAGNGSSGGAGGAGGNIRVIYLKTESQYEPNWRGAFQTDASAGIGGRGAQGGHGGRGGRGGLGGATMIVGKKQPDGKDGMPGADGVSGRDGLNGEAGAIEFHEAESFTDWIVDEFKLETEILRNNSASSSENALN
jgi:hypothetical protein